MRKRSSPSMPDILKEIQSGKIHAVYLLCGEESYFIENTLKQMLDELLDPKTRDFNLNFLDGVAVSVRDILSAVEVYPIMSDWRVVVVRESTVFKTQKHTAPLDLIQNAIDALDDSPRKAIAVMVKVLGVTAEQIAEQGTDFNDALKEFIEEHGTSLSSEDVEFLESLPEIAAQVDGLERISGSSDDTEMLIEWLQGSLPETSVLIFVLKGNVDARSRVVKAIDRVGKYVAFDLLETDISVQQDILFQEASRKLEAFGKTITSGAFNLLRKRTGNNTHLIFEEIEKIVAFVGSKQRINEIDIQDLVAQSSFDDIFALTDALGKRAMPQALAHLHSVLESGEPPIKVNAQIARQMRLALQAKLLVEAGHLQPNVGNYQNFANRVFKPLASQMADQLPKTARFNFLKQHVYAAYKIVQSLPYFSRDELIEGLKKTLDADTQLKSSQLEPGCILEQLVYELCARPKERKQTGQPRQRFR